MKLRFYVDDIVEEMAPEPTPENEFALKKVYRVKLLADHSHFGENGEARAKDNMSWSKGPAQGRIDLAVDVPEAMDTFVKGGYVVFTAKGIKPDDAAGQD